MTLTYIYSNCTNLQGIWSSMVRTYIDCVLYTVTVVQRVCAHLEGTSFHKSIFAVHCINKSWRHDQVLNLVKVIKFYI